MTEIVLCTQKRITETWFRRTAAKDLVLLSAGRLKRLLWGLCVWLKLQFDLPFENDRYETIRIERDTLRELIGQNQCDLRRVWNRDARYVIVGRETAERLWGEVASHNFYVFAAEMKMAFDGSRPQYRGMTVVIVPWIERGVFLLPELKEMATPRSHIPDFGAKF